MGTNKHDLIYFLLAVLNIVKTPSETQRAISRGWQPQHCAVIGPKSRTEKQCQTSWRDIV